MTLAATHRLALRQQAARRADDLTDARDRLEADPRLQAWADRWWSELEEDALFGYERGMVYLAIRRTDVYSFPDRFIRYYRRNAYTQSAEFDTLVEDVADGEPVPS